VNLNTKATIEYQIGFTAEELENLYNVISIRGAEWCAEDSAFAYALRLAIADLQGRVPTNAIPR
jgi:hypothetical protein